jgi:alginate O-acetyltransferase complex protein AlgI
MTEFWQRWHISLSTWFRDYLYIPMGGNSGGALRSAFNVCTVFLLCGLWHGASWTFAVFGLWHGFFLVAERKGLGKLLDKWPSVLRIAYVWFVVQTSLILFQSRDLSYAFSFFAAMAGFAQGDGLMQFPGLYVNNVLIVGMLAAVIGSTPIVPALGRRLYGDAGAVVAPRPVASIATIALVMVLLIACMLELSATTHNPFIYFRF